MNATKDTQLESLFGDDAENDTIGLIGRECSKVPRFVCSSVTRTSLQVGGGRGLFAACDIPPGSLILAEKPFIVWPKHVDFSEVDDLATAILQILQSEAAVRCTQQLYPYTIEDCDKDECEVIRKLFESYDESDLTKLAVAGGSSLEEIIRIALVLQHNGFGSGLYERQSLLNHSCCPNCIKLIPATKNGCSEIWTICDVKNDEELTICYVNPLETATISVREYLHTNHRFTCSCTRCQSLGFASSLYAEKQFDDSVALEPSLLSLLAAEQHLDQKVAEVEATLADIHSTKRQKNSLQLFLSLVESIEVLVSPYAAVSLEERPVRLLARACKAGISAIMGAIEVFEISGKPVMHTLAVKFLDSHLALLLYQLAYQSRSHPDIGGTLDCIADGILSLKQTFPKVFAEKYASHDWNAVVGAFTPARIAAASTQQVGGASSASSASAGGRLTATQCAKLCKDEARRIKALYSTARHFPAALKLFTAPPGSFYWGGTAQNDDA